MNSELPRKDCSSSSSSVSRSSLGTVGSRKVKSLGFSILLIFIDGKGETDLSLVGGDKTRPPESSNVGCLIILGGFSIFSGTGLA